MKVNKSILKGLGMLLLICLFPSIIGTYHVSGASFWFYAQITIIVTLIILLRNLLKSVFKSILSKLSDPNELSKYITEFVLFVLIIGIATYFVISSFPNPEIEASCKADDELRTLFEFKNPSSKKIEDFNLLIFNNAILNRSISKNIGVLFTDPNYYGVTFKGWSEYHCKAETIKLEDINPLSKMECNEWLCEVPISKERGHAVEIICDYLPPKSSLVFEANLVDTERWKTSFDPSRIGLFYISHWSKDTNFIARTILRCQKSPFILIYPDYSKEVGDEAIYILINGKYKFLLRTVSKTVLAIALAILISFFILKGSKLKTKIKMNKKLLDIIAIFFIVPTAIFLVLRGFKTVNWLLIIPGMFLVGVGIRLAFKNIKKIDIIVLVVAFIAWIIITIFEANNGNYITNLTGIHTANTYVRAFFANSFEVGSFLIGYFVYYPISKLKQKIDKGLLGN